MQVWVIYLLFCVLGFAGSAGAVDPAGFTRASLSAFEADAVASVSAAERLVSPVPGIAVVAQSSGEFRGVRPATRTFFQHYENRFGHTLRTSDLASLYREQALVHEARSGRQLWVAVPGSLAPRLRKAKRGADLRLLLRYLGSHGSDRVYVLVDFGDAGPGHAVTVMRQGAP